MKIRTHLGIVFIGALSFVVFCLLANEVTTPESRWYQWPLFVAVRVGLAFGKGGEDINVVAVNVVWALECIVAGVAIDVMVVCVRRWFIRNSQPNGVRL